MRNERCLIPVDWSRWNSQNFEDAILRMLFPYRTGVYVEIGGWHPTALSNTRVFYDLGWSGLVCEPNLEWADAFRRERPRDIVASVAVSDEAGPVTLYVKSAASSLDSSWTGGSGRVEGQMEAVAERLDGLLARHPSVREQADFCSIDVEGWERQVLASWDPATFRPAAFVVEAVSWAPLRRTHRQWEHYLLDAGYRLLCHNLLNRFYIDPSDTDAMRNADLAELWEDAK